jgi:hypothetical protein
MWRTWVMNMEEWGRWLEERVAYVEHIKGKKDYECVTSRRSDFPKTIDKHIAKWEGTIEQSPEGMK